MSLKKIAIATTIALTSSFAMAGNELDYDYVAVGYNEYNTDFFDYDTLQFEFSKSFNDSFYIAADAESFDETDNEFNVDSTSYNVNFGYNSALGSKTDFYTEIGYSYITSEVSLFDDTSKSSDNGYNAKLGIRSMLTSNFEVDANIQHRDVVDTLAVLNLEGRYHFSKNFSSAIKGSMSEDGDTILGVDFRYSF